MQPQNGGLAVLFDFDGTLVNTLPTVAECLRLAWQQVMGAAAEPDEAELLRYIGEPLADIMTKLLAQRCGVRIDDGKGRVTVTASLASPAGPVPGPTPEQEWMQERTQQLVLAYRQLYEPLAARARPFPGTLEMLHELQARGVACGIVTNKRRPVAMQLIRSLRMETLFDVIIGIEDVQHPKPAPEPLWVAADRLGVQPRNVVYVGDSQADIEAGRAARVGRVALVWWGVAGQLWQRQHPDDPGPPPVAELSPLPVDAILRQWTELDPILEELDRDREEGRPAGIQQPG